MQEKCGEFPRSLQKNWCTSGAIMFASPHFRRERFEPGCSDGPGSPGTCPTQATAAPVICCLRIPKTLGHWPGQNKEQDNVIAAASCLLKQSSYVFSEGTVSMIPNRNILHHFSILGEVISISIEFFLRRHHWFSQMKLIPLLKTRHLTWLCFPGEQAHFTHQKAHLLR
ncbi:hypothetical protein H8959_008737 [Pygathrix nigripes]